MSSRKYAILASVLILAGFIAFNLLFPFVTTQDEFLTANDGVLIHNYVGDFLGGTFYHPYAYAQEFQKQTFGLIINIYPPFISSLYALSYTLFGISLLSARLVHLLFLFAFVFIFYRLLREDFGDHVALWTTSILLMTFSFTKYFAILQRELPYAFFVFLAMYLLAQYLKTRDHVWLISFWVAMILGSMTKDFFLLVIPALIFMVFSAWRPHTILHELRYAARWHTMLLSILFIIVTFGFYVTKLIVSGKEKESLIGSFAPHHALVDYIRWLWQDVPILLVLFIIAVVWLCVRRETKLAPYGVLFLTYAMFMLAVSVREIRYAYMFYPLATLGVVYAITKLKKHAQVLLILFLVVTVVMSSIQIERHAALQNDVFGVADEKIIAQLAAEDIEGNILFLSHSFRHDVSFYLRMYPYNFDHAFINAFPEKMSAEYLPYSRFTSFYEIYPSCKQRFTIDCWDTFLAYTNTTIILIDPRVLEEGERYINDPSITAFAAYLLTQSPTYETRQTKVYLQ